MDLLPNPITFSVALFALGYSLWERRLRKSQYKRLFQYISHLVRVSDNLAEKNRLLIIENEALVEEVRKLEKEVADMLKTKPQIPTPKDQ